jgi:2,3-bisphosphoglycerate-independent phosphoglycerate mutase
MKNNKYLIIIPDGAADLPLDDLGGRTPLEAARTPNLDAIAREGQVGLVQTIPEQVASPGSDVALLSILGYDPLLYYTGRSPLEAASMGVSLEKEDVAFRCNLVSSNGEKLINYSGGEISTEEARPLIELINQQLGNSRRHFFPGISYRHLMVWRDGPVDLKTIPPHDIQGQPLAPNLPQGEGADTLKSLIFDSLEILDHHEINKRRRDQGKPPANMIWLWGQGKAPSLPSFSVRWGVAGAVIAAVDLVRGVAKYAGLTAPAVAGATGGLDTDFAAKGKAGIEALQKADFVLVHVEAPDEAGHNGDLEKKIWAIEQIDAKVVGPLYQHMAKSRGRMLILPDHRTPVSIKTHSRHPVPFVLWPGEGKAGAFSEAEAGATGLRVEEGHRLIEMLFE